MRQVLFPLVFPAAFFHQAVLAPDAFQSAVADGQIEFSDQAASAEGGKSFSQLDQLRFGGRWSFQRLVMASARPSEQPGRAVLLEAAQPLADGGHGGGEEPRGGLDAALAGAFDQPQAMVVGVVLHLTHQIEIAGGSHGRRILKATRRREQAVEKPLRGKLQTSFPLRLEIPPPRGISTFPQPRRRRSSPPPPRQQQFHLSSPFLAQTLQSRQGDTMCVGSPNSSWALTSDREMW